MFDKEEFEKAYEYIEKNKTNELFQSHYIRWRIARYVLLQCGAKHNIHVPRHEHIQRSYLKSFRTSIVTLL
jgi:hypothetical protein